MVKKEIKKKDYKSKRRSVRKFTEIEKQTALEVLSANEFNTMRTVAALGLLGIDICRQTLITWHKEAKKQAEIMKLTQETIAPIMADTSNDEVKCSELTTLILSRMSLLIPVEKSLNTLAQALRAVNEVSKNIKEEPKSISLIQTVYNNIIAKNDKENKNREQGNIQDVSPIIE